MNAKSSFKFDELSLNRGIYQLICWNDQKVGPCGIIFYQKQDNGDSGLDVRTRIDILEIYIPPSHRRQGIGSSMIEYLQSCFFTIHFYPTTDKIMKSFLEHCNFVYSASTLDWCWTSPASDPFHACPATDAILASLLGWRYIKNDKNNNFVGIPPHVSDDDQVNIDIIPSWSTDRALALALLINISDQYGFDHRWWKVNGYYRVGIRLSESSDEFADSSCGLWYKNLSIAIVDALIRFLRNNSSSESSE